MEVSAVVLSCHRPHNVAVILERLLRVPWLCEIHVWHQGAVEVPSPDARVMVHYCSENLCTWGRFEATKWCASDTVYTQDDDVLPELDYLDELHVRFSAHQSRITHGLDQGHYNNEAGKKPWALLGWGALYRREWVSVFDSWLGRYGCDELLRRKADRIFGVLKGAPHDPVLARTKRLPDDMRRGITLCLEKDHQQLTSAAVERARRLCRSTSTGTPSSTV